ncbi:MAG: hypothetical protein RLZZ369_2229, partial [Pseudomonadota bacterium]
PNRLSMPLASHSAVDRTVCWVDSITASVVDGVSVGAGSVTSGSAVVDVWADAIEAKAMDTAKMT